MLKQSLKKEKCSCEVHGYVCTYVYHNHLLTYVGKAGIWSQQKGPR
jgi:hypothetical protein